MITAEEMENKSAKRLSEMEILTPIIAHELRNHLAVMGVAVKNIAEKIKRGLPVESHISNIEKKILESEKIIKNFLSFVKIKAPYYKNVAVLDVLNQCISSRKDKYARWNVEFKKKFFCKKDDLIELDLLRVAELFSNILDNAFRSLHDKKGKIYIKAGYNEKKDKIEISFKDNGSGIGKKDLPRVFEPFFTKKTKSSGLGLAVAKQIVTSCGGAISIESVLGRGTTVNISLPLKRPG